MGVISVAGITLTYSLHEVDIMAKKSSVIPKTEPGLYGCTEKICAASRAFTRRRVESVV